MTRARNLVHEAIFGLDAVAAVPPASAEVWAEDHPFGALLLDLAWNDEHHAGAIRRWREAQGL